MKLIRPLLLTAAAIAVSAQSPSRLEPQLRLTLRNDPKTLDPLMVDEEASEMIRYLTGGVLIRLNRLTHAVEPELAKSWKITEDGRRITFVLREGVRFSDGSPFSAKDVQATVFRMMDPGVHSPVGDSFRTGEGAVQVLLERPNQIAVVFPAAVAGIERLFDQVAVTSTVSPIKERAALGPFSIAEIAPGDHIILARNPNYWRRDVSGRPLPRLSSIRFDIQGNRDLELLRFRRNEIHMISGLDAVAFEQLKAERPAAAVDAGPSYDNEMLWFNQVSAAPIPEFRKVWFRSRAFRRALSGAIHRADIARLVYRGHAQPASGPFSEANRLWFNTKLKPHEYAPEQSLRELEGAGFRHRDSKLYDSSGNLVEFSLITNSGNKSRARIAALIQQDLAKIGVRLNVVSLDFPALIERISRSYAYDACLLGLVNVDPDPNAQMNIWLSSAANHQWNPRQAQPATSWEAEIDRLMRAQASSLSYARRRAAFDRVQEIIAEQVPFVYLVTKNSLHAVDPRVGNFAPSSLTPQLLGNIQQLTLESARAGK